MSTELEAVLDHVDDAMTYLPEQFKGSDNLRAWISAFVEVMQDAEDMLQELWTSRFIDNATGARLDALGTIVGQAREGLGDDDYRVRIKVRIRANVASGIEVDIFEVFALLFQDTTPPIALEEYFPAALVLRLTEYTSISAEVMAELLKDVRATAVDSQLVYLGAEAEGSFQCASADATELDAELGFAAVYAWTTHAAAAANSWRAVCYSESFAAFVAVSSDGTNRTMRTTGVDATTWFTHAAAAANTWESVCHTPGLAGSVRFVAVSSDGASRVMTSPEGVAWTSRTAAAANQWLCVCYSPELARIVAVANTGANQIMYSTNGTAWSSAAASGNTYYSVCWSPTLGRFVALGTLGGAYSDDGMTWTDTTMAEANTWLSVVWVEELALFVAVSFDGTSRVQTSPDGITWSVVSVPSQQWSSIAWSPEAGLLVAVSFDGYFMASIDGANWITDSMPEVNQYSSVVWAAAYSTFMSVSRNGTTRTALMNPDEKDGGAFADVMEA